ncbi:MAG: hypothetical protein DRP01_10890 [Archaeoglobales archaeon]|nr:MAG: hypothetical protein DRP01_10890 [Archaeoglobales archaeon]
MSLDRYPIIGSLDRVRPQLIKPIWDDWFVWLAIGESIDGFYTSTVGSGTVSLTYNRYTVETGTTADSRADLFKPAGGAPMPPVNFDYELGFRCTMQQRIEPLAGRRAYISVGEVALGAYNFLGFYVEDDTLYAATGREGVGYTTEPYGTISLDTVYLLEAHLIPGVEAIFKVDGEEFARITTNLPTGTDRGKFMGLRIMNPGVGENKIMDIGFWEFRMKRILGVYV